MSSVICKQHITRFNNSSVWFEKHFVARVIIVIINIATIVIVAVALFVAVDVTVVVVVPFGKFLSLSQLQLLSIVVTAISLFLSLIVLSRCSHCDYRCSCYYCARVEYMYDFSITCTPILFLGSPYLPSNNRIQREFWGRNCFEI